MSLSSQRTSSQVSCHSGQQGHSSLVTCLSGPAALISAELSTQPQFLMPSPSCLSTARVELFAFGGTVNTFLATLALSIRTQSVCSDGPAISLLPASSLHVYVALHTQCSPAPQLILQRHSPGAMLSCLCLASFHTCGVLTVCSLTSL